MRLSLPLVGRAMGLDQYAGFRDTEGEVHDSFYWRKHARLQVFFAKEFVEQHKNLPKKEYAGGFFGDLSHLGFNGGEGGVKITKELINRLDTERQKGYPNCVAEDGFFWGQRSQEATVRKYKAQDEDFVNWCREQLEAGKDIAYDCSW